MLCDFQCFVPLGGIKITCALLAGKREGRGFNMRLEYKGQVRKQSCEKWGDQRGHWCDEFWLEMGKRSLMENCSR